VTAEAVPATTAEGVAEPTGDAVELRGDESAEEGREEGRRRRRGRGGRNRDEVQANPSEAEPVSAEVAVPVVAGLTAAAVVVDEVVQAEPEPVADEPAVVAPVAEVAPEAVVQAPAQAAPAVVAAASAYVLQLDELAAVARSAGLEWINSDADKVRTVQDAIANTPVPVRQPREPRPVAVVDEGPLILVETRRDLAGLRLPFEGAQPESTQA
jgi:ribonuclease E